MKARPLPRGSSEAARAAAASRSYLPEVHLFRALAITLIVAGHALYVPEVAEPVGLDFLLIASTLQNGTVLFVFIAGFLFEHLSRGFAYGRYLRRKTTNVLIPYLVLSAPVIVYRIMTDYDEAFIPDWVLSGSEFEAAVFYLLTGRHLLGYWFIPMIALFFLAAPVMLWLRDRWWLPALVAALFFVSAVIHRPEHNLDPFHSFIYFLPAYLFGIWFSANRDLALAFAVRVAPLLAAAIVLTILYRALAVQDHGLYASPGLLSPTGDIDLLWIQKMMLCPLALVLLRRGGDRLPQQLGIVATTSFGIYFLHPYALLFVSRYIPLDAFSDVFLVQFLVVFVFALVASLLATQIIRLVVGENSRMIVGS
jgi:probable poly-beta-1,6-N-acetyl-D-glucosamine export protein